MALQPCSTACYQRYRHIHLRTFFNYISQNPSIMIDPNPPTKSQILLSSYHANQHLASHLAPRTRTYPPPFLSTHHFPYSNPLLTSPPPFSCILFFPINHFTNTDFRGRPVPNTPRNTNRPQANNEDPTMIAIKPKPARLHIIRRVATKHTNKAGVSSWDEGGSRVA